jgi:hypothetical protein
MTSASYVLDVEQVMPLEGLAPILVPASVPTPVPTPLPPPPEVVARRTTRLMVFSTSAAGELEALRPHWEKMAANALEASNPCEPAALLPSLQMTVGGIRIVYVALADDAGVVQRLLGLFPLQCANELRGRRVSMLRLWNHVAGQVSVPLIDRDMVDPCLAVFLAWLRAQARHMWVMEFGNIPTAGAFCRALLLHQRDNGERLYRSKAADGEACDGLAITLLYPTGHYGSDFLRPLAAPVRVQGGVQGKGRSGL